jgi:hypothetical protein
MLFRPYFPLLAAVLAASLAAASACTTTSVVFVGSDGGGDPDGSSDGPTIDPEPDGSVADATPQADAPSGEKNPYGIPYPTKFIGFRVRSGSTRGEVLADLSFTGYLPNATTTSTIRLASVFDPEGRTHDIVALLLVSSWDANSGQLMNQLSSLPARVATFAVLGEGASPGMAATAAALDTWRAKTATAKTMWNALDPEWTQFGPLYADVMAVPVVVILDARTMEIVSSEAGRPNDPKQTLADFATTTKARPPAY